MTDNDVKKIQKVPHVEKVTPAYSMYGVLYAKSSASDKKFVPSVTVKFDKTRMKFAAGNLDDFMPKKGEVVISESYVKKMGFSDAKSAIGQTITLGLQKGTSSSKGADKEISLKVAAVDKPRIRSCFTSRLCAFLWTTLRIFTTLVTLKICLMNILT